MEVTIDCGICGAEHVFAVEPGERATRTYPGTGPSAEWIDGECVCGIGDMAAMWWRQMEKRAIDVAEATVSEWECPFDTVEEMMGER